MIPEIGHFALILALSLAICQGILPLVGAHRGDAAAKPTVRARAMRHAGICASKQFDFLCIQFNAMRMPNIRPDPPKVFCVFSRPAPELIQRIGNVLFVLGQMRVHHYSFVPRQRGRFTHQVTAHRKRRTWCDTHAAHGPFTCIMKLVDHTNTVGKNIFLILYQTVWGQAAC